MLSGSSQPQTSGGRVRARRRERGWSQTELARRAGISRAAVSAIEIDRLAPSVNAALKLAACLDCSVEDLFSGVSASPSLPPEWAWPPRAGQGRYWRAEVAGRLLSFPVEETFVGELAHDGLIEAGTERYSPQGDPSRTLVVACCDPAAGILASEYAHQTGLRMIVLNRSSGAALELLRDGRVHAAGVHLSAGRHGNSSAVGKLVGKPASLLRIAGWDEGVALSTGETFRSLESALRKPLQWVGREPGSGARQCLDALLGRRPAPTRVAFDHRGVAGALRSGWAQAGVCLRLVSEEAGLPFFSVRMENYDLCFLKSAEADDRIRALIRTVRSSNYRRILGELPGYDARETGELAGTP